MDLLDIHLILLLIKRDKPSRIAELIHEMGSFERYPRSISSKVSYRLLRLVDTHYLDIKSLHYGKSTVYLYNISKAKTISSLLSEVDSYLKLYAPGALAAHALTYSKLKDILEFIYEKYPNRITKRTMPKYSDLLPSKPNGSYLGKLCPKSHDYQNTGQSLRRNSNNTCVQCQKEDTQKQNKNTGLRKIPDLKMILAATYIQFKFPYSTTISNILTNSNYELLDNNRSMFYHRLAILEEKGYVTKKIIPLKGQLTATYLPSITSSNAAEYYNFIQAGVDYYKFKNPGIYRRFEVDHSNFGALVKAFQLDAETHISKHPPEVKQLEINFDGTSSESVVMEKNPSEVLVGNTRNIKISSSLMAISHLPELPEFNPNWPQQYQLMWMRWYDKLIS